MPCVLTAAVDSGQIIRVNAKAWARPFTARLLEPGLVSYEDRGCGKALLSKETIDRCINSFVGRPVVIKHTKTTPGNMKAIGHGYVTEVFYNATDGWWYGKGVVDTDAAVQEIQRAGHCSVAYSVLNSSAAREGQAWHDIPFAEEITAFSGEHLAIVDNPRYEAATMRVNSKTQTGKNMSMFKWFPKRRASKENAAPDNAAKIAADAQKAKDDAAAAEAATRENATAQDIDGDTVVEVVGADGKPGEKVTLSALIDVYNSRNNGADMDGDDEIMCNGKKYKVNAMIQAFDKWTTENAAAEDAEKKEKENAKDKAAKIVADAEAETARVAAETADRENGKGKKIDHIRVLSNARDNLPANPVAASFNSMTERLNRGKELYGSAPAK